MSIPDLTPPGHPVATKQFSVEIEGANADFLISVYSDQLMIMVSQLETFGTVLQAKYAKRLNDKCP